MPNAFMLSRSAHVVGRPRDRLVGAGGQGNRSTSKTRLTSRLLWRSLSVPPWCRCRVGRGGRQCLRPHNRRGSAPPPPPPASPHRGPTLSWVPYPRFVPAPLPDTPLGGGRSAGASCGAHQHAVQS